MKLKIERTHFLLAFAVTVLVLFVIRRVNPEIALDRLTAPTDTAAVRPIKPDSIAMQSKRVDALLLRQRNPIVLTDAKGQPVKNRVTSVRSFEESFPDLNDVQLATAQRLGVPPVADRNDAARHKDKLVYIDDTPYYRVERLTHSIPYLVPRAATLLNTIARAFIDSVQTKGMPFHKLVVTSVLRTRHDVSRLRRVNVNASEQSCHQYGTTFDISYNKFDRVYDPEGPRLPIVNAVALKSILAEVLEDQRQLGTCYVKYERKQACFHITAR